MESINPPCQQPEYQGYVPDQHIQHGMSDPLELIPGHK
jgi:hypothetical protein